MGFWPGFGRVGLLVRRLGAWALWLGCVGVGWGQDAATGAISGVVRDLGGVGVRGAVVRVVDVGTGVGREFRSGGKGEFTAAGLGAGRYLVRMEVSGYSAEERVVTVEVGGTTAVALDVFAGVVRQTVEVTAEDLDGDGDGAGRAVGVGSGAGGVGTAAEAVLTPGELAELPVNGREWQRFELLVPTASPGTVEDGPVSYRGEPETQNATLVDGVSGDQSYGAVRVGAGAETGAEVEDESEGEATGASARPYSAGGASGRHAGAAFVYSQEAVREFRVNAHGYSALYGHAAGGVVSAVTRGGGDLLHGTAFLTVRDSAWAARNPFAVATHFKDGVVTTGVVKPHDLRQQFGGSVGGALRPGRLFGFYVFDGQRRGFPAISSPGYAEFYELTATQSALLATRGVGSAQVVAALNYLDSLSGTVARRADQTVNFGRLDWQATGRNRFTLEGNRARWSSPAGSRSGAVVDRGRASLGDSYLRADMGVLAWGWSRGDRMSNDLRVQAVRDLQYEVPQAPLEQEPAISVGGYAPEVAIGPDGFTFGTPAGIGRTAYPDERRYGGAEVWTYARGGHVLQVRGEGSLVEDRIDALNNVEGTFSYDSGVTGGHAGGLVDWVTDYTFGVNSYPNGGCPSIAASVHLFCFRSYSQSFGESTVSFRTAEMAGFGQDTWRLGRRLTVGFGVRYEYELLPFPERPNGVLDGTFGTVAATGVFPEDRNNVAPRASVAWQPGGRGRTGKTTVRVGYGMYYGRLAGATIRSALVNTALPSSATHVRITPATETECPQVANQGFGYVCAYTTAPPAAVETTTSAMAFSRRFRLPAVQQGTVSLEREMGRGFGVGATYLVDIDRQLPNSVDLNIVPATGTKEFQLQGGTGWRGLRDGETFAVPVYTTRVTPDFGPVTAIESNGDATYNGVTVDARERGWRGLSVRGSVTYSKALDLAGSSGAVPRTNGQFDPFNVQYDKGLSALNRPRKAVVSGTWRPEVRARDRWVRGVANGWEAAGIFRATSGRPYSYNIFGGTYLKGGHESINGSGGAVYLPTVGRDTLALPMAEDLDVRVSRTVRVREGVRVRGSVEAFNALNRVNVSGVVQRAFLPGVEVNGVTPLVFQDAAAIAAEGLNSQAFGTATASTGDTGRERQVQVGVRVEF